MGNKFPGAELLFCSSMFKPLRDRGLLFNVNDL